MNHADFSNSTAYRYYRIYVTEIYDTDYLEIAEVEMMEASGTVVTLARFVARSVGGGNGFALPLALAAMVAVGLLALRRSLSRARSRGSGQVRARRRR